jgi:hypothetical protein
MKQDEIIEMAREVGLVIDGNQSGLDDLQAFAHLVAAKEREACAEIAEPSFGVIGSTIAQAIRARGEQA